MKQPSMLDDSIASSRLKIAIQSLKSDKYKVHLEENVKSGIDSQSYGEHSTTDDSDIIRHEKIRKWKTSMKTQANRENYLM